ncbi:MAG: phospholipase D-like domain-containing protein [Wenzhouxiangella sp.]|nr:phospholipase D-like domain-containing protein [Wenzhouxiangella sp.]
MSLLRRLLHYKTAIVLLLGLAGFTLLALIYFNATPKPARVTVPLTLDYGPGDERFARDLAIHMAAPWTQGNRLTLLKNGEQIFPAQFEAMRSARHHIHIETFQFNKGDLTAEALGILEDRVAAGVEVRLILDFAGSALADFAALKDLEEAGATVIRWRQPSWYQLSRLNHRTHRKLVIIDGQVGFIGGANMTDDWLGRPESGAYRDNHFRVEGPVVDYLQQAFMDNLGAATGQPLFGEPYFGVAAPAGELKAQVVISTPREGRHRVRKMKLMAIAAAREHIRLGTAYFYPDGALIDALLSARERGVEVDLLVPGQTIAKPFVRMASKSHWQGLLEAGVRIHEFEQRMFHAKLTIIDDRFVSIGSTNLDNRSFRINDEANLNVLDQDFAEMMIEVFERDLDHTRRYDLERWHARSRIDSFRGLVGRLLGPHL